MTSSTTRADASRFWHRENSFVTHRPTGVGKALTGGGDRAERDSDVLWQDPAPGRYNRAADARANAEQWGSVCWPSSE